MNSDITVVRFCGDNSYMFCTHNSPVEISKIVLMNFPHLHRDTTPGDLILDKPNLDGLVDTSSMRAVNSYKYLGVIFNPGVKWTLP